MTNMLLRRFMVISNILAAVNIYQDLSRLIGNNEKYGAQYGGARRRYNLHMAPLTVRHGARSPGAPCHALLLNLSLRRSESK